MENTRGNKQLLRMAKIRNKEVQVLIKFKPFRFQVKRITEYDSYKKISIVTNDNEVSLSNDIEQRIYKVKEGDKLNNQ